MSNSDFRKGANVTGLDQDLAEKAEEIQEHLNDISNGRKTGKAETFRHALNLAHERLEAIKEDKQEKISGIKELRGQEKQLLEELK